MNTPDPEPLSCPSLGLPIPSTAMLSSAGEPAQCDALTRGDHQWRQHPAPSDPPGHPPLTLGDAISLSDILRGCMGGLKLHWYPDGTETPNPVKIEMRAIQAGPGTSLAPDADIRDGKVWCSGVLEWWIDVPELIKALQNTIDGRHGATDPMAIIREREAT